MKTFTKTLIAGAMLSTALLTTAAQAAEQKIGVVDVQGIVRSLPQFAAIGTTIQAEFKDQIQEVQSQQEEYNFLLQKFQRESATMSEEQKKALEDQILALQKTLQEKSAPLQQELQRREQEEQRKLFALVMQAVNKIAADGNYDVLLNRGTTPFVKPEFDISEQVLEQVNKTQ
ncbi:OmpH family outer membrane protein [Glaciecola sp. MH2013]|uniref:OmpH family outer membrane protein n=1 Tax=Glaciecola sp. MH2013 TaxID=2785524 RepID=UPI00189E3C09|nr:OmpH family outer membrane protein [Glaciecola sp. MH2013]MBF7072278.1 OmpH family outer membrane protein [Glaciecola sp. MH2013]